MVATQQLVRVFSICNFIICATIYNISTNTNTITASRSKQNKMSTRLSKVIALLQNARVVDLEEVKVSAEGVAVFA
jgi:hypothetical protein